MLETLFEEKKGIICDLDGTLYNQKAVRRGMLIDLLKYYARNIQQWKELYGIFVFRRLREMEMYKCMSIEEQIGCASSWIKMRPEKLNQCIQYWMFEHPLYLIEKHQDVELLESLKEQQRMGKIIIVYSDYLVEKKLNCLKLEPDYFFYPGINGIDSMKPSLKAMQCILRTVKMNPEELLFIGDRKDKDGESAKLVGMKFGLVRNKRRYGGRKL